MKRVAFANIVDEKNIGDMHCNPGRLTFVREEIAKVGWEVVVCDFRAIPMNCRAIVFGGGGMLHPHVDAQIERMAKVRPSACWGIGINYHSDHEPEHRRWKEALLAMSGPAYIRDPGYGRLITPCPSVLDPRIEVTLVESAKTPRMFRCRPLFLSHKQHPIGNPYPMAPRYAFNDGSTHFEALLGLIGRSRAVVTNTFHGAYWSILLGVQPWIPADMMFSTRHSTLLKMGAKPFSQYSEIHDNEFSPQHDIYKRAALEYLEKIKEWLSRV